MQLDSTFAVTAPIDQVWSTLMDFERVAGCVPGAEVTNRLSQDAYQVAMKVKLGPVTMQYKGQMEVAERDATGHRAVLKGSAKEARGQGTAQATAQLQLVEDAGTTRGSVSADVVLSGRAAAMGQGVIGSVTDQMMAQFAQNLQFMLNEAGPAVAAAVPSSLESSSPSGQPDAPATEPATDASTQSTSAPAAPRPAAAAPGSAAPGSVAPGSGSLDGLALARGIAAGQLQQPQRVMQLLAVVALVSYKLGQRAVRSQHTAWASTLALHSLAHRGVDAE